MRCFSRYHTPRTSCLTAGTSASCCVRGSFKGVESGPWVPSALTVVSSLGIVGNGNRCSQEFQLAAPWLLTIYPYRAQKFEVAFRSQLGRKSWEEAASGSLASTALWSKPVRNHCAMALSTLMPGIMPLPVMMSTMDLPLASSWKRVVVLEIAAPVCLRKPTALGIGGLGYWHQFDHGVPDIGYLG